MKGLDDLRNNRRVKGRRCASRMRNNNAIIVPCHVTKLKVASDHCASKGGKGRVRKWGRKVMEEPGEQKIASLRGQSTKQRDQLCFSKE